jgi:hypothetical protein
VNQRIYELDAELRQNQNVLNLTATGSWTAARIAWRLTGSAARNSARDTEQVIGRTGAGGPRRRRRCERRAARGAAQRRWRTSARARARHIETLVAEMSSCYGAGAFAQRVEIAEIEARIAALRRSASLKAGQSLLRNCMGNRNRPRKRWCTKRTGACGKSWKNGARAAASRSMRSYADDATKRHLSTKRLARQSRR